MAKYKLSDGRVVNIPDGDDNAYQKMQEKLKEKNLTAELIDESGNQQSSTADATAEQKSQASTIEVTQSQKNQLKINEDLKINLDTGEVIKTTESKSEDGSLDFQLEKLILYNSPCTIRFG